MQGIINLTDKNNPVLIRLRNVLLNHFDEHKYLDVLEDFRAIFNICKFETEFKCFQKARDAYELLKKEPTVKNYWREASTPFMRETVTLISQLKNKKISRNDSELKFREILTSITENKEVLDNYTESFMMLVDSILSGRVPKIDINHMYTQGNSGTTLFCQCFDVAHPVLSCEKVYEEAYNHFFRNINNPKLISDYVLEFFFVYLIGCYEIDELKYKTLRIVNIFINKNNNLVRHSEFVKKISIILANMLAVSTKSISSNISLKQLLKLLNKELAELVYSNIDSSKLKLIENKVSLLQNYKDKKYDQVLANFKVIFDECQFDAEFKYFQIARTAFYYLEHNQSYSDYWRSLSTPLMTKATKIYNDLIQKKYNVDYYAKEFSSIVAELFPNNTKVQNIISESFSIIVNSVFLIQDSYEISPSHLNSHKFYIITSGMGWSGSSAVTDYLREFKTVHPVMGEVRLIEAGYYNLISNFTNKEQLYKEAIKFFFIHMLGCYELESVNQYKCIKSTKQMIAKAKNIIDFATQIKNISVSLAAIIRESQYVDNKSNDSLEKLFRSLCSSLFELIALDVPFNAIPLIDNCVHIGNIATLNYSENIKIVCTFRDPRAIYISQILENAGFVRDSKQYIQLHRKKRESINNTAANLNKNFKNNIIFINFENFVLQKQFREELIKKLGLKLDDWVLQEKYFKPNVSAKNVRNFCECQDEEIKKDVQLIADELKEYCIDIK